MSDNVVVTIDLVKKYIALTEAAREKATPATVSYTHLPLPPTPYV